MKCSRGFLMPLCISSPPPWTPSARTTGWCWHPAPPTRLARNWMWWWCPADPAQEALMQDEGVLGFLRQQAAGAKYVTSVCTGALVLGAAGLLTGYRATTHWTAMPLLPLLGATPVAARIVVDRNRLTGGGVTAGIDFGLHLAAVLRGEDVAKQIQLELEYNPQPPFDSGTTATAPGAVITAVRTRAEPLQARRLATCQAIARRAGRS